MSEKSIYLYESRHNERYVINVHHHENYQVLYVIEGKGSIQFDNKVYTLEQDNVAVVLPFSEHAVSSDSQLTLLVLAFDDVPEYLPDPAEWRDKFFPRSEHLKANSIYANELRQLLRKLLFDQIKKDALSGWSMRIYLLQILLLLARAKQSLQFTDANGLRAERIRNYLHLNYFEHITSNVLAYKFGISVRYLNNIFKEQFQMTPMQYLTEVRMSVAKKLLDETDKDIVSICFEVGYESLPTFYRTFKNVVHKSPNKYRQKSDLEWFESL